MEHDFVIGLGSNLGDRAAFLVLGIERIAELSDVVITALSPVYETPPVGPPQPYYLNAALRISSRAAATEVLDSLLAIERALGRTREVHWGPRVLDLDILWSDEPIASAHLTIPHVHLRERAFALAPLLDVAPELAPAYAIALQNTGGAPPRRGSLTFDPRTCHCAYVARAV